jgi:hypothetical protein
MDLYFVKRQRMGRPSTFSGNTNDVGGKKKAREENLREP